MTLLNWDLSDTEEPAASPVQKADKKRKKKDKKKCEEIHEELSDTKEHKDGEEETKAKKKKKKKEKVVPDDSDSEQLEQKEKKKRKSKFKISGEFTEVGERKPEHSTQEGGDEPVDSTADDQGEDATKPKKNKLSMNKRKSIKHKERKRRDKLNHLKSIMPKEALEEYLKPKVPDQSAQQAALSYLRLWSSTTSAWKFSKVRQTWLLQHIYDDTTISDTDFAMLLDYMQDLKGLSKDLTMKEATQTLEKHKDLVDDTSILKTSRATQILQILD